MEDPPKTQAFDRLNATAKEINGESGSWNVRHPPLRYSHAKLPAAPFPNVHA
jgi:hypothetical protein